MGKSKNDRIWFPAGFGRSGSVRMKARILHELPGRLRVHLVQSSMSLTEADVLESYLSGLKDATDVKVYERTADAVIRYQGGDEARTRILRAIAGFDYDRVDIPVPEHSGRKLQHEYVDRLAIRILKRACSKLFLPASVRSVITVAKAVHISSSYLSRVFTTLAGQSFCDYICDERMSLARQLLNKTDDSIDEISNRCGFSSPNYFSMVFKKYMGQTPTAYRKNKGSNKHEAYR